MGGPSSSSSLSLVGAAALPQACPKARKAGGGRGSVGPPRLAGLADAGTRVRLEEDLEVEEED